MRFMLLKAMPPVLLTLMMLAGCGGGGGSPTGPSTPAPAPSPSPDATIGSAGGTLSVANGAARLVVPAGALAANVGLTLRATTHVPLDPHAVGGSGWELGPAGTTFAVPAQLTLIAYAAPEDGSACWYAYQVHRDYYEEYDCVKRRWKTREYNDSTAMKHPRVEFIRGPHP